MELPQREQPAPSALPRLEQQQLEQSHPTSDPSPKGRPQPGHTGLTYLWGKVPAGHTLVLSVIRSMSECVHGRATSSCGTTPALAEMRRRRGGWAKGWRVRRRVGSSKYQLANRYLFSKSSPATLIARNTLLIGGACPDRCRSPAERGHYVRQF